MSGHPFLISAVGTDELGNEAVDHIRELGVSTELLRRSAKWPTGTATVFLDQLGQPTYRIPRPAAYDDVELTRTDLEYLQALQPDWICYGTLFSSHSEGLSTLYRMFDALPQATRFYDINLRKGLYSDNLVSELIAHAHVVKLNEAEASVVGAMVGLPGDPESFCCKGTERYGWKAVCVTLGERGCVLSNGADLITASGEKVVVLDTVGAGDAFSAAFVHGLSNNWPAADIASFANKVGALVASRPGAIPEWSASEAVTT